MIYTQLKKELLPNLLELLITKYLFVLYAVEL